ncbi:DinB family protein [Curtobacterium oceanosedimentum]|uniref:DinB family protein n=1 Tax=Curtobacterium oceanosedimentum TaxID=465820 RepID=UPI001AEA0892
MAIEADTKDWTWVIGRACPDCGFDGAALAFRDVPAVLTDNAAAWPEQLARDDVRQRPDDHTWSPLEYGAHVRDVHRKMTERLQLVLAEDDPAFPNWDQDATAVQDRYDEQDPAVVSRELTDAARAAAAAFAAVPDDALGRTGRRSDGSVFTVATLATYSAHDPVHHLWDVRRTADRTE